MSDIITVVEGLDFVVSLAEGHVHPDDLQLARSVAADARTRVGHLGSTMILALVGGTGSGKSSLLNAIADERIASTSDLRPHTTEPLAWIPADAGSALRSALDRLGIECRVPQDRLPEFAILDMTDVDSVVAQHRERVEALLPDVDVVVWVLDPEKYADARLHRDFIAPMSHAQDRIIFVLNQVDRLDEESLATVRRHLIGLLADDGFEMPTLFEVAADPPGGRPRGVRSLVAHFGSRLREKRVHAGKVVDDARRAARMIATAAGVEGGGAVDFEERWAAARESIIGLLLARDGAELEEAFRVLERFIIELSTDVGGKFGVRIRHFFGSDRIAQGLEAAAAARGEDRGGPTDVDVVLQEHFGAPLRTLLWERASLSAVVAGLTVDAGLTDVALGRFRP